MNRYIDADKHLQKLGERRDTAIIWELNCNDEATKDRAQEAILIFNECILELINAPTADVVEVVRCKDCKYYVLHTFYGRTQGWCERLCDEFDRSLAHGTEVDDYCSFGERAEA